MKTIWRYHGPVALSVLAILIFIPNARAQFRNAWQITDNTNVANTTFYYLTNLPANLQVAATNVGFRFAVDARFVTDFGAGHSITMIYGLGDKRFLIWFDLNSQGDLRADLDGGSVYTLTTNGNGNAQYHTHEIVYNGVTKTASYVFDGQVITNNWPASDNDWPAGQINWGAGSSPGKGQMNFHSVSFEITNGGIVASYDAGGVGNPSPDPQTLGWTLSPATPPPGVSTNSLSPDDFRFVPVTIPALLGVYHSSVAWGDFDKDGMADFLLAGYSPTGRVSQLWRNVGGAFSNVTASAAAGLPAVERSGVAWGDFDYDGNLDLLLTGDNITAVSQLWKNTGNSLSNATEAFAPDLTGVFLSSVAWGDYDNDGRLDFLLTGADNSLKSLSQLWRNTVSGFSNVTATVIPGLPSVYDSSVAWGDFDNDGRLDFLLTGTTNEWGSASPTGISQLWRNTGGSFSNVTATAAPGLPGIYGGSVGWADYNNDGWLDFLITGNGIAQLWRNTGSGFTNVPIPGLPGVYNSSVAWGDYDNDGRLDFLLTGSSLSQLWRNTGSGFTNVNLLGPTGVYRGSVAWGDFDNDGRLDFLLTGRNGPTSHAELWRNNLSIPVGGPILFQPVRLGNGQFQFSFNNHTTAIYEVLGTTNVALPVNQWDVLGLPHAVGGGLFRFTDTPNQPKRYYLLRKQ